MSKVSTEIRFTGFGGQGIILAGFITGKAASIFDNLNATMRQSYGPESRGGYCSTQLIISNEPISYPNITTPDVLVVMSQEGYTKFKDEVKSGGTILLEEDMVKPHDVRDDIKMKAIPATRLAEKLGRKVVTNIVMLGFMAGQTDVISQKAMENAIKDSVPKGTEELNIKAFKTGYNYKPKGDK